MARACFRAGARGPALLLLWLAVSACASSGPQAGAPAPSPSASEIYRIAYPDRLSIRILPEPLIEREETVRPDGRISVDLVGDVIAAGRTPDEVSREIESRIHAYREGARVMVSVIEATSAEIPVLGEVRSPGAYPLEGRRVSDAIAEAAGKTPLAASSRVRLIRQESGRTIVLVTNLDRIENGNASSDYVLRRGDIVSVPPAAPVSFGYAMRRALYPLEQLMRSLFGVSPPLGPVL